MKRLIFVLLLFMTVIASAQTNTTYWNGDTKVYVMYEDAMTDSTGNYYTAAIPLDKLDPAVSILPIHVLRSSAGGTANVIMSLEGRTYDHTAGSWGAWVAIPDTLGTANTETWQFPVTALAGGERPEEIRVKCDGQAGSPADTILKVKVFVKTAVRF